MARGPQAVYDRTLKVRVTKEMHEFLELLAKRQNTSKADVIRQAIREYLDEQEDVIGSRSRLGSGPSCANWSRCSNQFLQQLPSHQRTAAGGHHPPADEAGRPGQPGAGADRPAGRSRRR